jgi:hypothetical protein
MDFLSKLQAVEDADTCEFTVRDPATNAPLMALVLAGPTHPNMLALKKRSDRNLSASVKRSRDFGKAVTSTVTELLDDEDVALAREMERQMAGTLGWKDPNGGDAEGPPFDGKLMETMYRKKKWLRDVVNAELARVENFTRSSVSS